MNPSTSGAAVFFFLLALCCAEAAWSEPLPSFPAGAPWAQDVSAATVDPNSASIISYLQSFSPAGFGTGRPHFDLGIHVLYANCSTPHVPALKKSTYYQPACGMDSDMSRVTHVPLPREGALEGRASWAASVGCSGDCHLAVYDTSAKILYEGFACNVAVDAQGVPTSISCVCMIAWKTDRLYPAHQRGIGCTSADAAGFPISPLLATPEEVRDGVIAHALRFIMPNARMRALALRAPASHFGGPQSTNANAIAYGTRIRLKASYDCSGFAAAYQVFCATLKKYGALLSDGGNIPFTIASDRFRSITWDSVGFTDTTPFNNAMPLTEFEVLEGTTQTFASRPDCVLTTESRVTIPPAGCAASMGSPTISPAASGAPTPVPPSSTTPAVSSATSAELVPLLLLSLLALLF